MKNMLRAMMITPVIALAAFSVAHAQSSADLQAQLNALLAQLAALQAQLPASGSSSNTTSAPTPGASGQCPALNRALRQGMSGSDVTGLQAFLAADSSVYPEATVSGYFGALTQAAVQRFQARHAVVSSGSPDTTGYGAVGPATRAAIASLCVGGSSSGTQTQQNCSQGGMQMASGTVHDFYSVTSLPVGASCAGYAQTRQCINGVLSGNAAYQYASCTVDAPISCSVGNITLANGDSRLFYLQNSATSSALCSTNSQTRACANGVMTGDANYNKTSCSVTLPSCLLDGASVQAGESRTFYLSQNIPSSEQCSSYAQTRTCSSSGSLSGSTAYKYANCAPVASGSCALDSAVVSSGASATFYSSAFAPIGATCASISQARTCTSGAFSGTATYNRASCSDTASCSLSGITVAHGESHLFYASTTVAFGTTCSAQSLTRVCTNGSLSGDVSYQYTSCQVSPPISLAPKNAAQLAAALTALQSVLQSLLDKLDSWF